VLIRVISSDGDGLAQGLRLGGLSRVLGRSIILVAVGSLIMAGMITWVLILAAHDGVRRRGDKEVSS
jgi:hypothetical protein